MNGLELQDILLTFPEGGRRRTVLDIPYLKVTSGEHIGIRGASGSGKSSLLNVVSGLVLPDRGTVRWGATVPARCPNTNEIAGAGNISVSSFRTSSFSPSWKRWKTCSCPQPSPDGASRKP